VFDGAELVARCHSALAPVLDEIGHAEVLYVDDGSRDATLEALRAVQAGDGRVRVVELAANYGQHAALLAGIEHARGARIVTLDVDLQCDPRDLPRMLAALDAGCDFVSGVRLRRRDPRQRALWSRVMTMLANRSSGVPLRDVGCPMNAITIELAREIARSGELRRFAKPVAARLARRVAEVEVRHAPRAPQKPRSSYSATRLVRLFMDFLLTALGDAFAWVFVVAAAVTAVLGVATVALIGAWALAVSSATPVLVVTALFVLAGVTALLALIGELVRRTAAQVSGAPLYVIRRLYEPLRGC
jgi:glycosyltransferase involved in cell wall biosynthesis